jgi:aminoglycoside phosphotransferase (APT) family kinase protein
MHARLAAAAPSMAAPARLLRYDASYYRRWPARAEAVPRSGAERAGLREVLRVYVQEVPDLLSLPQTFIHGEYHASNILVGPATSPERITPVDWEMAALAPGLMDLADLTAGNWTDDERDSIGRAYRRATTPDGAMPRGFRQALDQCRLHRAVQWLGWSDDWRPPREHAQDWLGEALRLCERIRGGRKYP